MGRTPWSARVHLDPLPQALTNTSSRPTWASAADQGVRPTLHSSIQYGADSSTGTPESWRWSLTFQRNRNLYPSP